MAEEIRTVDYYYLTSPDKPGEGAKILSVFQDARVNLLAVHAFPQGRRVQVDIVPEDAASFLKVAKKVNLELSKKKKAFLAMGDDKVGVVAGILAKLAKAKINIIATTAITAGKGRFGAIFWVKPSDMLKASKALGI